MNSKLLPFMTRNETVDQGFKHPYEHFSSQKKDNHLFFLIEEADYILKELVLPKFDFTLNLKVSLPICRKIRER